RGRGKPETFKFLGFVLISAKSRRGDFQIRRKSRRDRMSAKLREIKEALRERRHVPVPEVGKWLAQVVGTRWRKQAPDDAGMRRAREGGGVRRRSSAHRQRKPSPDNAGTSL